MLGGKISLKRLGGLIVSNTPTLTREEALKLVMTGSVFKNYRWANPEEMAKRGISVDEVTLDFLGNGKPTSYEDAKKEFEKQLEESLTYLKTPANEAL